MSLRTALAAAAVLAIATPAFTQVAPAAPPAAAADAEAAFEARAEAFEDRLETMKEEMEVALAAAGTNAAKADTDLDAIEARYQPEADAFAVEFGAFLSGQLATLPEEQRTAMAGMMPVVTAQIKGAPAMVRTGVEQAAAAAAAPAVPQ